MSNDPRPVPRARRFGCLFTLFLIASIGLNLLLFGALVFPNPFSSSVEEEDSPTEKHLYGKKRERDKIAVIRAEGALVEGLDGFILKQIEAAAKDDHVKAVVLRIDSPGGTIGASEDIHRELTRLVSGAHPRHPEHKPKKLMASMGSIAASGGYYIAMPAEKVFVEKNTITGSIGVYASFPNVSEFADKYGVKMELIKAGGIKGSGSPFHEMTPAERQPWQDMVDQAYTQFLDVVVKGRPQLTAAQLRDEIVSKKTVAKRDHKGNIINGPDGKPLMIEVTRVRADGGTYTAAEAQRVGLVDAVGLLEDVVTAVASSAGVSEYRVVTYERPPSLLNTLLGIRTATPGFDAKSLSAGLTPRLWYMAPGAELGGIIAVSGK
ncbi:S49 family peptidase [Zavarzinella formosa]|uniref:S49 family peptidase n=1 Tax=Zavarzinella formosa TaxID=360055 RepID=UPI0002EFC69A|nr:S49 family peptidase [Zavarzinella formosa]